VVYNGRALVWLQFALCLVVILVAGTRLARYADVIAEKSSLGHIWVGLAVVALVTATPEMATSVSSAALVGSADLAVGTLIGSCCFNLSLLFVLDVVSRKGPVLARASERHLPSVRWGLVLLAVAAGGMVLSHSVELPLIGWLSIPGLILLVLYPLALRRILKSEKRSSEQDEDAVVRYSGLTLRGAVTRFGIAAAGVIVAGVWLSFIGDEIATVTGWGTSFVGNLFLAIATSAPELVVSVSAVRMGFPDIALADILGANMLDTAMIGLSDASYVHGSLLAHASLVNVVVIVVAAIAVALAGLAIVRRHPNYTVWRFSRYGPTIAALYIGAAFVLFTFGSA